MSLLDLAKIRDSLKLMRQKVAQLHVAIDELHERRAEIAYATRPRTEVIGRLAAAVDQLAARYTEPGGYSYSDLSRRIADAFARDDKPADVSGLFSERSDGEKQVDENALCWFFGDAIKARLASHVMSMPWPGPEGLPVAERAERIAALDAQIAAHEAEHAKLIDELRAAGIQVTET